MTLFVVFLHVVLPDVSLATSSFASGQVVGAFVSLGILWSSTIAEEVGTGGLQFEVLLSF